MATPHQAMERDEELTRRQREARREIRVIGDPVLRERAREVTEFDRGLRKLAKRMVRIMRDAPGVGLAAPQVGVLQRLIVYEVDEGEPQALVNPEIVTASAETETGEEGCLSVPDSRVPVERALRITVRAHDVYGEPVEFEAEELEARVIQHEHDHLEGVLIVDRTTREARSEALRALRDAAAAGPDHVPAAHGGTDL
jgi:peptide deformylase